jgi:hypothetical protein
MDNSIEARLMSKGAQCVAGSIVLRNVELATLRNGCVVLTEAGEKELDIVDVVIKSETFRPSSEPAPSSSQATPARKSGKKKKDEAPAVDPAPQHDPSDLSDIIVNSSEQVPTLDSLDNLIGD